MLHGSANPIGGKNQVIKLRWGKTRAEDCVFEGAMPGIKFALGENPKDMRQFGQITGPRRYPVTRMGVEYVIRDAFTRAKAYQKAWQDYDEEEGRRAGRRCRRGATCSSSRWSRCSRASGSCTRTATARTRS